jgi:hypothetical protein
MNSWQKNRMTLIPHHPYPPDLAPSDFLLFPKPKMLSKGQKFNNIAMMHSKSQDPPAKFQISNTALHKIYQS